MFFIKFSTVAYELTKQNIDTKDIIDSYAISVQVGQGLTMVNVDLC